ncbi:hypothetical protein C3460_11710 [Serratia marcescens]|nr:hypothetical protein C3462_13240 [Serratia marcescens]POX00952.1 hypothetical protein C3466_13260 [Serratia marcescens]POX14893.1 hypothetical protein C3460_11710 [Serratia marcescens]PQH26038.1 hypothetical protein C5T93_12995 [Raoultella ornithinolytica]
MTNASAAKTGQRWRSRFVLQHLLILPYRNLLITLRVLLEVISFQSSSAVTGSVEIAAAKVNNAFFQCDIVFAGMLLDHPFVAGAGA